MVHRLLYSDLVSYLGEYSQTVTIFVITHPGSATLTLQARTQSLPAVRETRVRSLYQEDPLEKAMATDSSTLA